MATAPRPTEPEREVHAGHWIEVHGRLGEPPRRGYVLEVLGEPGHEHYRVRWDEEHEAIFYPADGIHVMTLPGPDAERSR